jgi:hypothetical protein
VRDVEAVTNLGGAGRGGPSAEGEPAFLDLAVLVERPIVPCGQPCLEYGEPVRERGHLAEPGAQECADGDLRVDDLLGEVSDRRAGTPLDSTSGRCLLAHEYA